MGIVDGLGFEEVNQAVTETQIVSGLNLYATGSLQAPWISGTNVYATSGVQSLWYSGADVRVTDTVEADTVSGGDIRNAQGPVESVAIGSTTTQIYGGVINAGSGTLGGGSTLSVEFGATYTAEPHVICSYIDEPIGGVNVIGSNVTIAGFEAIGDTASKDFNWIAVGV